MESNPATESAQPSQEAEDVVVAFESREDLDINTPDHDPHGEPQALAARSTASCDECGESGLVPTHTLEVADGLVDGVERRVLCEDCSE
jgi:hypothetical protein